MVPFHEIINHCFKSYDVYIPLIQRNYKWDAKMAADLATDLWSAYKNEKSTFTLGMITFYENQRKVSDDHTTMQLIDGQQRITTLLMLLKYIQPSGEHFTFKFERDKGIKDVRFKRQSYLNNIAIHSDWEESDMYSDVIRFKTNYEAIKEGLERANYTDVDGMEFAEYIANNVYLLLHISEAEPFDEFINLNKNKTRFVISDRIKAYLLIDHAEKSQKEAIVKLFQDLSEALFKGGTVWNLINKGYVEEAIPTNEDAKRYKDKHYPDENRLKILCCERHGNDEFDSDSTLNYKPGEELAYLTHYREILFILLADLEEENWKSYNAYSCLYELNNKLRFFNMLNEQLNCKLESNLLLAFRNLETLFEKACFIESQLADEPFSLDCIKEQRGIEKEFNQKVQPFWFYSGEFESGIFEHIYLEYIGKKYKSNVEAISW